MAASFSIRETGLWPTLGQTLADLSRAKDLNRETLGAGVYARSLDRGNGMERTGAHPVDQELFGGIVAGKGMDSINTGNMVPRDAVTQTYDAQRGMQTMHMGGGMFIDTFV